MAWKRILVETDFRRGLFTLSAACPSIGTARVFLQFKRRARKSVVSFLLVSLWDGPVTKEIPCCFLMSLSHG